MQEPDPGGGPISIHGAAEASPAAGTAQPHGLGLGQEGTGRRVSWRRRGLGLDLSQAYNLEVKRAFLP